jgi:hypothetical protein
MRTQSTCLPRLALLTAALAALCTAPTLADSACKGLEQAMCEGKAGCSWVAGYTRKDGIQVSGHCKSKGKRSDTPAKANDSAPAKQQTSDSTAKGAKSPKPEMPSKPEASQ